MTAISHMLTGNIVLDFVWTAGICYVLMAIIASLALAARTALTVGDSRLLGIGPGRFARLALLLLPGSPTVRESALNHVINPVSEKTDFFFDREPLTKKVERAVKNERMLVLTGRAGIGKTTLGHELCRRYRGDFKSTGQIPVLIQLSQYPSASTLNQKVVHLVSEYISSDYTWYRTWVAKGLINSGSLFMVFDDLDYLNRDAHLELEWFIKKARTNAFMCIMNERPHSYNFLKEFNTLRIPDWTREEAIAYINRRVPQLKMRSDLIKRLDLLGALNKYHTAAEWKYIVDTYLNGELHKLIALQSKGDIREREIFIDYVKILITNHCEGLSDGVRRLGKLALHLLKDEQTSFNLNDQAVKRIGLDENHIQALVNLLFERRGDAYNFKDNAQAVYLAGYYLGQYWQEAKGELKANAAALVWSSVYNIARKCIADSHVGELEQSFQNLWDKPFIEMEEFDEGIVHEKDVETLLAGMTDQLFSRLSGEGRKPRAMTIGVHYEDHSEDECDEGLPGHIDSASEISERVPNLLRKVWHSDSSLRGLSFCILGVKTSGCSSSS